MVKIFGLKENIELNRNKISTAIHDSVVTALEFPKEKKFQRFIKLDEEDFIFPDSRSKKYLVIEIVMFKGRSNKAKKNLINLLFTNIRDLVGIEPNDLEITLIEAPAEDWGIRGKIGSDLIVDYNVKI